ncbi:MAG TPA: hypothetical protein VKU02_29670, partial [Gemmataceae bacterium]|nr:hypothetical protein [Gemmataceae bacterium]
MAGGLLHKFFGSAPPAPPGVAATLEEAERLANERPELAGSLAVVRDLLPLLYREPVLETAPQLLNDHAAVKLHGGVPLLRGERLELDRDAFQRRWQHICTAMHRHQGGAGVQLLAEAMRKGTLDPAILTGDVLSGQAEALPARADALGLDSGLMATILRLTLFPVLERVNVLLVALREGMPWSYGYCPTCGSWPLLGEFRGLEQTR